MTRYLYQCSTQEHGYDRVGHCGWDLSNIDDIASTRVVGKSKKKLEALIAGLYNHKKICKKWIKSP